MPTNAKQNTKNVDKLVVTKKMAKALNDVDNDFYDAVVAAHEGITAALPRAYGWMVTPLLGAWFMDGVTGATIPEFIGKYQQAVIKLSADNRKKESDKGNGDEDESDDEESDDESDDDESSDDENDDEKNKVRLATAKALNEAVTKLTNSEKKRKRQDTKSSSKKKVKSSHSPKTARSIFESVVRDTSAPAPTPRSTRKSKM